MNDPPRSFTGPSTFAFSSLRVEPVDLVPEFLAAPFCPTFNPFGVRLSVTIAAAREFVVQNLGFSFVDRFGATFTPAVLAGTVLTGTPVTFPSSSAVPMPNSSPLSGVMFAAGTSQTLPLFLQFGCGVRAPGTLFLDFHAADRRGFVDTARLSLRVGR